MKKVLVLEDEKDIRDLIVINLERAGYDVIKAEDGNEALAVIDMHKDLDMALLDVMVPGVDGLEVCKILREKSKEVGIIMLTAKSQEIDKIMGLHSGADDYMVKPFSPMELLARLDALYRRVSLSKPLETRQIKTGPYMIDLDSRRFFKNNEEITLTQTEFEIVRVLISKKGQALSREDLLNAIWGEGYFGEVKVVDVNIRRIRQKIEDIPSEPKYIRTIWGFGYCWRE